jgi:hypothetical protein
MRRRDGDQFVLHVLQRQRRIAAADRPDRQRRAIK